MTSLITEQTRIKVSSVLNKDHSNYGKQHLLSPDPSTCWNSDSGTPQYILLDYPSLVQIDSFKVMFQGGFVGKSMEIHYLKPEEGSKEYELVQTFYPRDDNTEQIFEMEEASRTRRTKRVKVVFTDSTDFYGRITVYKFDIIGKIAE
ncbi:galactose-binding domain-containing protein [Paraphysoderma sedebokerense]|nr:galactose-binding domain-containing protein [Paraphysoderma sedebokerense]KAI9138902.1 galactose-binding domain-containing protein [Paraphysoderma sedebokerense]